MSKRLLHIALCLLPLGLVSQPAINWRAGQGELNITPSTYILKNLDSTVTIHEILKRQDFESVDQDIISLGITDAFHWLKLNIINDSDEDIILEIPQYSLANCTFYIQSNNNQWTKTELGYQVPIINREWKNHFQVVSLQQGQNTVFIRYQSYSPPISLWLKERGQYLYQATELKVFYGLYVGILLFVILNNVFLFFTLRNVIHLLYVALAIMHVSIVATVMDGFAMYITPAVDFRLTYILVPALTQVITIYYGMRFLEIKKYSHRVYRIAQVWLVIVFVILLSLAIVPYKWSLYSNQILGVLTLFLSLTMGFTVARKGNALGYYFAVAYTVYFVITIFEIIHINTGSPRYILGLSFVSLAILFEVLSLAYALTKKFQWERMANNRAQLEAQQELLNKTKENERIVREQNVILEEKVTERTRQLEKTNIKLSNTLETVKQEKAKSESLLLNILPEATAEELKEKGFAEPKSFEEATVLFTDFKDFTSTTSKITPTQLVASLNDCFKRFDAIILELGLEKIKTIGDSYMAAAGIPEYMPDHAEKAIEAAIKIRQAVDEWLQSFKDDDSLVWEIRIGIHSGPVIGGVVGAHKFAFDIWGDTVNLASRMEQLSEAGKINISDSTYELVKNRFICSPRGKKQVKGKGMIDMYWVDHERESVS